MNMTKEREELFNRHLKVLEGLLLQDINYFRGLEKAGGGKRWKKYKKLSEQQLDLLLKIKQIREKIS